MNKHLNRPRLAILAGVFACLIVLWSRSVTEAPIVLDAVESVRMGVNFAHHGVISGSRAEPVEPTMYREPLPAFVNALGVSIIDDVMGETKLTDYYAAPRAKYLKYQNLFWAALMTGGILGLLLVLTNSFPLAIVGAILVNLPIPGVYQPGLDSLYSEPVAKSFLAIGALLLALWAQRGSRTVLALAGVAFGLLALTKAIFLYVFLGLLIVLPFVHALFKTATPDRSRRGAWQKLGVDIAVLGIMFAVVTVPWMWRNYVQFGSFAISERSGVVMLTRALKNQLTRDEYLGWFYVFAPNSPVKSLVGKITGFSLADLQQGGRLQRLSREDQSDFSQADRIAEVEGRPEDAIAYYRRARAWRAKLANEYQAMGADRPVAKADEDLKGRATDLIKEHPWRHLAFVVPALWRGALFSTPIFAIALLYAWKTARKDIALAILPSLGMIALYALATPFEFRFGTPVMPLALAMVLVLLSPLLNYGRALRVPVPAMPRQ